MRDLKKFIDSIYLGDRYCEKLIIKKNQILLQMDCISRLQEGTNEWNFYSEEDIVHGYIVFDEVMEYTVNKELKINDEIYEIQVLEKNNDVFSFRVYGCNVSKDAVSTEVELNIKAKKFYIYNTQDGSIITK